MKIFNIHRIYFALLTSSCTLLLAVVNLAVAGAAPGDMLAPFDIGSRWNVCQGYDNRNGTHNGTSRLSLDLTGDGCDSSASGKIIRSPFDGTVSWYAATSGSLCVTSTNGKSIMLTHINSSLAQNTQIAAGQAVGTIAAPGQRQNNGVAHLHLQAWSSQKCSNNADQVAFDSATGTHICGLSSLPATGQASSGGTWAGTKFIAQDCNNVNRPAIHRFYSPATKRHLFTSASSEISSLANYPQHLWQTEGVAFRVKSVSNCEAEENVYRFYSESLRGHLFTTDENEKSVLQTYPVDMWRYEGVAYCASRMQQTNTLPVYRFYSDSLQAHLFTTDENEKSVLQTYPVDMWRYEGVAYYVYPFN